MVLTLNTTYQWTSHYYLLLNPLLISKAPSLSCQLFTGRGGGRAGGRGPPRGAVAGRREGGGATGGRWRRGGGAELGLLGAAVMAM